MPRLKRKKPPGRSVKFSKCRLLLIVDNEPLRRRALKDYLAAEKNLLQLRGEMETFETQDLPAYNRWEASVFGALLTEIREIQSAIAEKQRILAAVEEEAYWTNCSMAAAYRKVMRQLSQPEPSSDDHDDDPFSDDADAGADGEAGETWETGGRMFGDSDLPPGFDFADYDAMSNAEKKEFRAFYADIAAIFEAATGIPAPNLDDVLRRERGDSPPPPHAHSSQVPPHAQTSEETRLKTLYRRLARELHPDANPDHGWRERELWHEVQAAYEARDLDRLEAAAGRVEVGAQGAAHNLPLSRLARMTRDLRSAIRGLKTQIRNARTHAAWNFSACTVEGSKREKQHRRMLEQLKTRATAELARFSKILDALAAKAAGGRNVRRKPRKVETDPRQMEFF